MPITLSAKKKVRKDKKRTLFNRKKRDRLKRMVKSAREKPTKENLKKAYSYLDKAVKTHLIHKNKAARIKSRLAKLVGEKKSAPKTEKVKKPVRKIKRKSTG